MTAQKNSCIFLGWNLLLFFSPTIVEWNYENIKWEEKYRKRFETLIVRNYNFIFDSYGENEKRKEEKKYLNVDTEIKLCANFLS